MKIQDLCLKTYSIFLGQNKILKSIKFYSISRLVIKRVSTYLIKQKFKNKIFNNIKHTQNTPNIIVSLTSFPARINYVWITISSLLEQTMQPNKIILWLSKEQFTQKEILPKELLRLEEYGVEIRLVDGDIRSHKKFFYSFKEYPNDLILLVDDDLIYPTDTIEKLYNRWVSLTGKRVICSYGSITQYDSDGVRLPYNEWSGIDKKEYNPNIFFGSGGGTLIKPSDLYGDILKKELFWELTPHADDIWLNAMCRLGNVKIYRERFEPIFPISIKNNSTLSSINLSINGNDKQLDAIDEYYKTNIGIAPFAKKD